MVLLVAAAVLAFGAAGLYLIWAAPGILAEVAFEAFLASALIPGARRSEAQGWLQGTVRATVLPFAVMLVAAVGFGWAARTCARRRAGWSTSSNARSDETRSADWIYFRRSFVLDPGS